MKVLMVGPYPAPGTPVSGGVERVIDTLLPTLGKQVELTLAVPGAEKAGETHCSGVRVVYFKRSAGFGFLNYWTIDARRVRRLACELDVDIVHVEGAAGWGLLVDRPKVLTVHGIAHRDILTSKHGGRFSATLRKIAAGIVRAVERWARQSIGNVIVINPYVLDEYPDALRYRHWQIPNPLDSLFVRTPQSNAGARQRTVVIVGKVCSRKNTLEGVRIACAVLKGLPDATLRVAGDLSDRDYVERCKLVVTELGVASRTEFLGNLRAEDLVRLLDESSVMLMTSKQETAPMAIVEAQSRGVPSVAPRSFGIKTMIEPGVNGVFLPVGDFEKSVDVLRDALTRDWDRGVMAGVARQRYSVEAVSAVTVQVYREILGAKA